MTLYEAREQIRRNTILVDVSDLELEDVLFDNKRECIRNFKVILITIFREKN